MSVLLGRLAWTAVRMASYLRAPALITSSIGAVLAGVLYAKQNELIYPRNVPAGARTEIPNPADFNHEQYEDLRIKTVDGETLAAFLIKPRVQYQKRKLTILMFHGNAGNIGHRVPIALKLQDDLGCNVFMLECRGYGASTGSPDEQGMMLDAQASLDYLHSREDLNDTKVVVYGQSLGGALGIQLVAANKEDDLIVGLILENTFTSLRKLIPSVLPPAKYLAPLCHQIWPSDATLPKIDHIPILFLSGLKDEIVPAEHMRDLYHICRANKKIWKDFPNGTHNETILQPRYFDFIEEFIKREVMGL